MFKLPTGVDINTDSIANTLSNTPPAGSNVSNIRGGDTQNTTVVDTKIIAALENSTLSSLND